MKLREETMDLFDVPLDWCLAHCIASDLAMGAGIAVPMNEKFALREAIKATGLPLAHPTVIRTGRVFNLVTKKVSWQRPQYNDLAKAIRMLAGIAEKEGVMKLAMPKIGCGLDRQPWDAVRREIDLAFASNDIEVLVCVL